jgi:hypothetical protein
VSAGLDAWLGTPTYALRSLRVLRNDGSRFTDVTSTAVPAVDAATVDDWRGDALAVRDVDADGRADIVVSTKASISNKNGTPSRRMRFFRGVAGSAISFTALPSFEEPVQVDSGEADDLLFVGDLGGAGKPVLLLLGEGKPNASSGGARSRAEDWKQ